MFILAAGAVLSLRNTPHSGRSLIFSSRHSIANAAQQLRLVCEQSINSKADTTEQLPSGTIVRPERADDQQHEPGSDILDPATRLDRPVVVYAYGEPSLLYHLHREGVTGLPVSHLNLTVSPEQEKKAHSFLVIGPNAKRTPGFWEDWLRHERGFERVDEVTFYPSAITLLNYFSPKWLREHPEAAQQVFEVYRISRRPE